MGNFLLGLLLFCHSNLLLAAEPSEKKLVPLSTHSLLETSGGLLLILVVIFGAAWLFKRFGQLPLAGKGLVTVLGGVSVGPRERVVVVKVENTRLVVGVAPGQVRTLHILDGGEPVDASFKAQLLQAKKAESPAVGQ